MLLLHSVASPWNLVWLVWITGISILLYSTDNAFISQKFNIETVSMLNALIGPNQSRIVAQYTKNNSHLWLCDQNVYFFFQYSNTVDEDWFVLPYDAAGEGYACCCWSCWIIMLLLLMWSCLLCSVTGWYLLHAAYTVKQKMCLMLVHLHFCI